MVHQSTKPSLKPVERAIVDAIVRRRRPLTRSELSVAANVPRPTVVSTVSALIDGGILEEKAATTAGRAAKGRPSAVIDLHWADGLVFVSWRRRRLSVMAVGSDGNVLHEHDLELGDVETAGKLIGAVKRAVEGFGSSFRMSDLVMSVPKPYSPGVGSVRLRPGESGGEFAPTRIPEWLEHRPELVLSRALDVSVQLENDANLEGLGEFTLGPGDDSTIYVSISDGVGAALILNGELFRGAHGLAGEIAHVRVTEDGRLCSCGNRGCLITTISDGPFFVDEVASAYGTPLTQHGVIQLAAEEDPGVLRILGDLGRAIGRPIADLVTALSVRTVILDGRLGVASEIVANGMRDAILDRAMPIVAAAADVRVGTLRDRAALQGAVTLRRNRRLADLLA